MLKLVDVIFFIYLYIDRLIDRSISFLGLFVALFLTGTVKPDRKVEERKRGRQVAKHLNPGRLLSAVWDMVACSFQ